MSDIQQNYNSQPVPLKPQAEPIENVAKIGESTGKPSYTDVHENVSGGLNQ